MNRRRFLGTLTTGVAGLTGCLSQGEDFLGGASQTHKPSPQARTPTGEEPASTTPESQFQYNARNSGFAESGAPRSTSVRWRKRLNPVEGGISVADSHVLVAASGNLVNLDAETGEVHWDVPIGVATDAPPAVTEDTAYVTCWNGGSERDRGVAAIALADGSERWRAIPNVGVASAPTLAGGVVYVGGSINSTEAIAIAAADGQELWRFDAGQYASTPAVNDDVVYVGGGERPVIYALGAEDGEERWQVELDAPVWGAPTVVDGTVFVGSRGGTLYGLSVNDGQETWQVSVGDDIRSSVGATDESVIAASSGVVAAIDTDGDERWSYEVQGGVFAPTLARDAVVVTDDSRATCLNPANGTVRWVQPVRERQISDQIFSGIRSPPEIANGKAYIASFGGDVYALGTSH